MENQTISVKLKRHLRYKHHYQFEFIRPHKVLQAACYLVKNSELFRDEGIQVNPDWVENFQCSDSDWSGLVDNNNIENGTTESSLYSSTISNETQHTELNSMNHMQDDNQHNILSTESTYLAAETSSVGASSLENAAAVKTHFDYNHEWCELEEHPAGTMDTLLEEPDITELGDRIITFAPGEGNTPLGIFIDKNPEFLSFPTIYCGKTRHDNKDRSVPVHYSTVCKWELRCQDRRVSQCVPNIFYKLKKLQIKQIQRTASLGLRKCKTKSRRY